MSQSASRDSSVKTQPQSPHGRADTVVVPRINTLDGFIEELARADGIVLTNVDAFTTLVVQTENSVYKVTILRPDDSEVLVQGGAVFPVCTKVCLSGSSLGSGILRPGWVGVGFRMEFQTRGQRITTSRVRAIAVVTDPDDRGSVKERRQAVLARGPLLRS